MWVSIAEDQGQLSDEACGAEVEAYTVGKSHIEGEQARARIRAGQMTAYRQAEPQCRALETLDVPLDLR